MLEIRLGDYRVESHAPEKGRYTSPLVLVHGLWAGAWCWRHFASFLAHRGWQAFAPDLRGRPESRAGRLASLTFDDYVADVSEVMGALPAGEAVDPPIVIGHDVGGIVALRLASKRACRAAIALAPPLRGAQTDAYRTLLGRKRGWFRPVIEPPDDYVPASGSLQPDSPLVAAEVREGVEIAPAVSTLIVGGERDPLVDASLLQVEAQALGAAFATRDADHWSLEGSGFERHVDVLHRWLVRELGEALLRFRGWEDLEEEEG